MKACWLVGVAVALACASPALAQPERSGALHSAAPTASQQGADFALPVSIERIRRELASTPRTDSLGLRLDYYVEVHGKAITFDLLFPGEDLATGQVPYAGLTHREFIEALTPEEFKSPPMDLANLARILQRWLLGRVQKR